MEALRITICISIFPFIWALGQNHLIKSASLQHHSAHSAYMAGCRGCMGSQCKGLIHWAWPWSCTWATGTRSPFLPLLPPLEHCHGRTTKLWRTCKGCDIGLYFQLTLLSLVWAQAWGRQGFRGEIGSERLHFEGEVVSKTPTKSCLLPLLKNSQNPIMVTWGQAFFHSSPSVSPSGKKD